MKGTLTEQPLAELLREISVKGLSGALRLEHERVQAAVYFDDGEVIYAAANLRQLRLREYLSKRGIVSENEGAGLGANLSDLGLAAALRAKGAVSEKDLNALLTAVVTDVLRVALLWTEGGWTFNARARLDEPVRLKIDTHVLLREAAQRLPMNLITMRFRNPAETISRAAVSPTSNILPAESFLLSRLDQPTRFEDAVALSSLPQFQAYRVIYGLALSGLIKREFWQNAFRTGTGKTPEKTSAPAAPAVPVSAPEPTDNRWTTANTEDADLENFLQRLGQAVNYYEVIQMPTTAGADEIKNAYYALARRYHPDRFHLKSGTPLHAKISSAFARITQAYETLTDVNARLAYDQAMERARQFAKTTAKPAAPEADVADEFNLDEASHGASESDRPEYNFREGVAALQQGRINAAITYLASAARLVPDEARYRAHYGRALAAGDATRRLAENEMQAAVKLEPNNADFRTMLAELYFDLKFYRRAQTEVDRALALSPNHALARSLLRKLEKSRKVG
jgi:curved DNA-binding protein CbpA